MFPSPVKQVVSVGAGTGGGANHATIALLDDGTVWSVGGNGFGQLGTGGNSRSQWMQIAGLSGVQQISAGNESVYALLADKTVMAWGDNSFGQLGANVSGGSASTPVQVAGLSNVAQVSSGTQQCFFLLTDGTVRAIGRNTFGAALGDGSSVSQSASPVQVSGLSNVTQIAGFAQGGYAVKSDGTVWSWGSDYAGALGKGTTPVPPQWSASAAVYASSTPVQVQGLSGKTVVQVAGSFAGGVVRTSDGAVYAWGDNTSGFVGDGTTTSRSSATAVSGLTSGVARVTASGNSAYAIKSDGSVIAWGDNSTGQLGTGNTTNATTPVNVSGLSGLPITGFMTNSPSTNRMYLYVGTATVTVDVDAQVPAGTAGAVVAKVTAGSVPVTGAALTLSASNNAQLGASSGSTGASGTYQTTVQLNRWTTPGLVTKVTAASGTSAGSDTFVSLGANALGFGLNQWAELGDGGAAGGDAAGSGVARTTPSQLLRAFPSPVKQVVSVGAGTGGGANHATIALLDDGTVWSVGGNGFGQLGTGGNSRTTWARVTGVSGVQQISAGNESVYALLADKTVMAWGDNSFGQLGANVSGGSASTPVQVAGLSNVAQVSSGTQQCFFLLTDGTVRAIGRNTFGAALGDGSSVSQSASPVQVSGLSNVTQIAGFAQGGYAVKSDGTVWSWGSDYAGALGKGTTPVPPQWSASAAVYASSTPVQVQGLSGKTVVQVAGSFAGGVVRTSDGAVYAWGDNASGFVGDGTTTSRSSATAVSGLTSGVARVTASGNSAYAIKSDGSVIAWGDNSTGQLGTGNTTNATTPVAVSGLSGLPITGFMTNSPSTNRMYLYTAP
ncbi:alpha-tubulin suppressor-like RCC1 family protein [Microbacterium trichothecenolyticum]|uniref:Alpha-tubulin suppressor-like RCC1 family protein n=1 Tax=Microbacterium trichothecenolyticum TaxID=69370 RepID=A0ABU0TT53_MICTR|nr:alpha-tubulin suppressor-like RCC1 family protein [Microbacterium trichothecenolyticum]